MDIKMIAKILLMLILSAVVLIAGSIYILYPDAYKTYDSPEIVQYSVTVDLKEPTKGSIVFEVPNSDVPDYALLDSFKEIASDMLEDNYLLLYTSESQITKEGTSKTASFDFIAKSNKEFIWKNSTFEVELNPFYSDIWIKIVLPEGFRITDFKAENSYKGIIQGYEGERQILTTKTKGNEKMDLKIKYSKI